MFFTSFFWVFSCILPPVRAIGGLTGGLTGVLTGSEQIKYLSKQYERTQFACKRCTRVEIMFN